MREREKKNYKKLNLSINNKVICETGPSQARLRRLGIAKTKSSLKSSSSYERRREKKNYKMLNLSINNKVFCETGPSQARLRRLSIAKTKSSLKSSSGCEREEGKENQTDCIGYLTSRSTTKFSVRQDPARPGSGD